ncbi:putative glycoside hydrolase, partial [Naviculisporaceae sp. PSN 640]
MVKTALAVAALAAVGEAFTPSVAVYWGQRGGNRLRTYCDSTGFEYITVSFVTHTPEQDTSGLNYPGTNFGAHCGASVYTHPTTKKPSKLLSGCTQIAEDIPYCQSKGKRVLLSIGGADVPGVNYTLTSTTKGTQFADFLWGAFGPYQTTWGSKPRPFDLPNKRVSVDGFDLDIEANFTTSVQAAYSAFASRMRQNYNGNTRFKLTAAPECPLNDPYFKMKDIIKNSKFDALFVQFYNNYCGASGTQFNYVAWENHLKNTASSSAKIFIGLPAAPSAASPGYYLEPKKAVALINQYKTRSSFGGVMFWDAFLGLNKSSVTAPRNYYEYIHDEMLGIKPPTTTTTKSSTTSTRTTTTPTPTPGACKVHVVQQDEYCWLIADKNSINVDLLRQYNPQLNAACNVYPGDRLCVS